MIYRLLTGLEKVKRFSAGKGYLLVGCKRDEEIVGREKAYKCIQKNSLTYNTAQV